MAHAHQGTVTPRVVTFTISDTRTEADDVGGRTLRELLTAAGCVLDAHAIVPDEPEIIREAVRNALAGGNVDAVVTTGGTGITPRDQTVEALAALCDRTLEGFGEAFRRLSWDEVGARSILSRAFAGTSGRTLLVALPGSVNAVKLGVTKVLTPMLPHAVALLRT